jgi:hypothetical protein
MHAPERDVRRCAGRGVAPRLERGLRQAPEGDHGLNGPIDDERIQPAVPVRGDDGVVPMTLAAVLAEDAVHERVHQDVPPPDPELREEPLHPLPRLADEAAAGDRFVGARVLADHQHGRGAVEPPAVEDRTPLDAEVRGRVHIGSRVVLDQRAERLSPVARIEALHHPSASLGVWLWPSS